MTVNLDNTDCITVMNRPISRSKALILRIIFHHLWPFTHQFSTLWDTFHISTFWCPTRATNFLKMYSLVRAIMGNDREFGWHRLHHIHESSNKSFKSHNIKGHFPSSLSLYSSIVNSLRLVTFFFMLVTYKSYKIRNNVQLIIKHKNLNFY